MSQSHHRARAGPSHRHAACFIERQKHHFPGLDRGWPQRLRHVWRHAHRWVNLRRAEAGKQPRKTPEENLVENPARPPQPPTHTTRRRRVLGDTGTHRLRGTRRLLRRHVPNPPSRTHRTPQLGRPDDWEHGHDEAFRTLAGIKTRPTPDVSPNKGTDVLGPRPTKTPTHRPAAKQGTVLCVGVQEGGVVGRVFGVVVGTVHGLFVLVGALGGWVTGCTGGWYSRWYSSPAIFS